MYRFFWGSVYMQADWRSWTYGRAPNVIYISLSSLTSPSKHRHGATLLRWNRPISVAFYNAHGDTEDLFSSLTPGSPLENVSR